MWHFIAGIIAGGIAYSISRKLTERSQVLTLVKYGELINVLNMVESRQLRHQSLAVLELVYKEADKTEEYEKIKLLINNKYEDLEKGMINTIKQNVTYEIKYNNLDQAVEQLAPLLKIAKTVLEKRKWMK